MVERSGSMLDRTYGALGHEIRRELLERLKAGPVRVTDLAAPFDVSLASVSKHIRVLEAADLVGRRIAGRDHFVSARTEALHDARDWIDRYTDFWTERLDALESELRGRR